MELYGKACQWYGREPQQRKHHESLEDYSSKDTIIIKEKAIKQKIINSCWRKMCTDVMHDFTEVYQNQSKFLKETVNMAKKKDSEWRVLSMDLGETHKLMHATPEDLTEDIDWFKR